MEYLNKSKICREFLNQYSDTIFPELLPKLMKVAILALYKTFHKWNFSLQELDEFINFFNYKNKNLELESNKCPCPPCEEYLEPKVNKIQKLNMGFRPPEEESFSESENGAKDCYGYGKFYPNDDVYINEKNNFYDENYYVPRTRSYRNIQLYHKRLANPKFITQEKKIYPHWWWNLKDDIEQEDYCDDESIQDHRPRGEYQYPKDLEERRGRLDRHMRNKSFNGSRPVLRRIYDESKIFPNSNLPTNNSKLNNSLYPKKNYSPSEDESFHPYRGTATDGFGRPIPNKDNNNPNNNYAITNNSPSLQTSPLYGTSPNLNYHGPGTGPGLGPNNRPGIGQERLGPINTPGTLGEIPNENNKQNYPNGEQGPFPGNGAMSKSENLTGTSALKSQILNKRKINKQKYIVLSYDKDFNVNGAFTKVRGQQKKGLKYSLSGNQLKEDKKGIRRRKKNK